MQVRRQFRNPARGFTLTEMLIVISIVILLAVVTIPIALRYSEGRRTRDASRTIQAVLAGARDRAMGSGFPVGIRLIQEANDRSIVRSMAYIQQRQPENLGQAKVLIDATTNAFRRVVLLSYPNKARFQLLRPGPVAGSYRGDIRFEQASRYYSFSTTDALLNLGNANSPELLLDEGLPAPLPEGYTGTSLDPNAGADYKIPMEAQPTEDINPIRLPDGVVIDLGSMPTAGVLTASNRAADPASVRLTRLPVDSQSGYFDILFSPTGQVMSSASVEQFLALWIREELSTVEEQQVTASIRQKRVKFPVRGTHLLMTVVPRTGSIKSVDPVLQDTDNDGFVDYPACFNNVKTMVNSTN